MGWNDGPDCRRCHEPTVRCEVCKGRGEIWGPLGNSSCTECNATGWVCERDGNYWNR